MRIHAGGGDEPLSLRVSRPPTEALQVHAAANPADPIRDALRVQRRRPDGPPEDRGTPPDRLCHAGVSPGGDPVAVLDRARRIDRSRWQESPIWLAPKVYELEHVTDAVQYEMTHCPHRTMNSFWMYSLPSELIRTRYIPTLSGPASMTVPPAGSALSSTRRPRTSYTVAVTPLEAPSRLHSIAI